MLNGKSSSPQSYLRVCVSHPYVLRSAALLTAASVGHNTVRALLVAAVDDVHPSSDVGLSPGRGDILHDVDRLRGHDLVTLIHPLQ